MATDYYDVVWKDSRMSARRIGWESSKEAVESS